MGIELWISSVQLILHCPFQIIAWHDSWLNVMFFFANILFFFHSFTLCKTMSVIFLFWEQYLFPCQKQSAQVPLSYFSLQWKVPNHLVLQPQCHRFHEARYVCARPGMLLLQALPILSQRYLGYQPWSFRRLWQSYPVRCNLVILPFRNSRVNSDLIQRMHCLKKVLCSWNLHWSEWYFSHFFASRFRDLQHWWQWRKDDKFLWIAVPFCWL